MIRHCSCIASVGGPTLTPTRQSGGRKLGAVRPYNGWRSHRLDKQTLCLPAKGRPSHRGAARAVSSGISYGAWISNVVNARINSVPNSRWRRARSARPRYKACREPREKIPDSRWMNVHACPNLLQALPYTLTCSRHTIIPTVTHASCAGFAADLIVGCIQLSIIF